MRHQLTLTMWLVAPVAAVSWLHRLRAEPWLVVDLTDLSAWLTRTPLTEAAAASLRLLALGIGWWLIVSTGLHLLACLSGWRELAQLTSPFTVPVVRRAANHLVAGSLVVSLLASPAWAEQIGDGTAVSPSYLPDPIGADTSEPEEEVPLQPVATGVGRSGGTVAYPSRPSSPGLMVPDGLDGTGVTAEPGDNLWVLARRHLESRGANLRWLTRYWLEVIDVNRDRLRSGDPDLIYPGEVIVLPPFDPPADQP